MKKIKHRYSGKKSRAFWELVASIKKRADQQEVYSLGVALQNMEVYVLRQLKSALNHKNIATNENSVIDVFFDAYNEILNHRIKKS